MNMRRLSMVALLALVGGLTLSAQAVGESFATAAEWSEGSSRTAKLVDGTDEFDESTGVFYAKLLVEVGQPCTVYTTGKSSVHMDVYEISNATAKEPTYDQSWAFSGATESDDKNYRIWLEADDWGLFQGDTFVRGGIDYTYFYLKITGSVGQSVTLNHSNSVILPKQSKTEEGTDLNPKAITFKTTSVTHPSTSFINGWYCFSASLKAGVSYKIGILGSTAVTMKVEHATKYTPVKLEPLAAWSGDGNIGYVFTPSTSGTYRIQLVSDKGGKFKFRYQTMGKRTPEEHKPTPIDAPTAETPVTTFDGCQPGHRNDPTSGFRDDVIDEQLFKVELQKGETYAFATTGAETNLVMELYDAKGAILESNRRGSKENPFDCKVVFRPSAAGAYYLGVCQNLANDETDVPTYGKVGLTVSLVTKGDTDEWDPADDDVLAVPAESYLAPALGMAGDDVIEKGALHGKHVLGETDWADCYGIACRKGITYRFRAKTADADSAALWPLMGRVYAIATDSKGKVTKTEKWSGDLVKKGISFVAPAHATYFMEVVAEGGKGVVTFPYELHSLASDPKGGNLGTLRVLIHGADAATWSLESDGKNPPKYPSGACVIVPTEKSDKVVFSSASGRTAPAKAAIPAFVDGQATVEGWYSDTCDSPADDYRLDATKGDGGPKADKVTTLKPAALGKGKTAPSVSRTLWAADAADWYKFTIAPNTCYVFNLVDGKTDGDARIEVFASADASAAPMASGTKIAYLSRVTKSTTYYVRVSHADGGCADSQYVMEYYSQAVGAVGFSKSAYTVKDNVAYLSVPVKRTGGKAGLVRVHYETQAITAVPGEDYEPQSGELEWKDGESKDATIKVKIIPDLVAKWAESRSFALVLSAIPQDERGEGEWVPYFKTSRAEVTIADATKAAPGTVQFCGWGYGDDAFANAKKPAAEVAAGDDLLLWLSRTGGSDGRIAVKVTPTKGKAKAGVDFEATPETIVWEHGDDEAKPFRLRTYRASDAYVAARTLSVKLSSDKAAGGAAKKLGGAVTVSIVSPEMSKSVEAYAAAEKAAGLTVKAGAKDTWYFDNAGSLRSVTPAPGKSDTLTVTLTGPGKLSFTPYFDKENPEDASTFTCVNGKKSVPLAFGEETVLYLPSGKATLKFTFARAKGSASDAIASFADVGDGQAFAWKPLPLPACVSPIPGEVAATEAACPPTEDEVVKFMWTNPNDPEIAWLFTLDEDKKKLGKTSARIVPQQCDEPEIAVPVVCTDCGEDVVPKGSVGTEKTYYWRVDSVFLKDGQPVLTNVSPKVWTAKPMKCADKPQALLASGTDANGVEIASLEKIGTMYPVTLVQGVAANIQLSGENVRQDATKVEYALAAGSAKLPAGLSVSKTGGIVGTPTKTGTADCAVCIKVSYVNTKTRKTETVVGSTIGFRFTIVDPGLAAGTFSGLAATDDARIADDGSLFGKAFGPVSVTATAAGKITAKVTLGGTDYKFEEKKAGYGACVPALENGLPGVTVTLTNVATLTTKEGGKKKSWKCPNTLTLVTTRASADDPTALDAPMTAEFNLHLLSADGKSILSNVVWKGEARRGNAKIAAVAERLSAFAGYYTVSLNPANEVKGVTGSGYLGITLDKKGAAKVSGVLADGSKASCSAAASFVSELADGSARLLMPVYVRVNDTKKAFKQAFGGWLTVVRGEDGIARVVSEGQALRWLNTDKTKSADGTAGYELAVEPIGGIYNTVYNLQRYYLDEEFRIQGLDLDEIPADFFGGKVPTVYPGSFDAILDWQINSLKLAANPANMTFSFKRATGIWTGTFDIFVEGQAKKFGGKSYSHRGVLVMYRDPAATIGEDVPMMGFCLLPMKIGTRSWTASLPFDVVAVSAEPMCE